MRCDIRKVCWSRGLARRSTLPRREEIPTIEEAKFHGREEAKKLAVVPRMNSSSARVSVSQVCSLFGQAKS